MPQQVIDTSIHQLPDLKKRNLIHMTMQLFSNDFAHIHTPFSLNTGTLYTASSHTL